MTNHAGNAGAKNLYIISVKENKRWLNRLPAAGVGKMGIATVNKSQPEFRKKVHPAVVIQQWKSYWRKDSVFLYFEDNTGIIHSKQQGRDERFCCHRTRRQEVCRLVAQDCIQHWQRCMILQRICKKKKKIKIKNDLLPARTQPKRQEKKIAMFV